MWIYRACVNGTCLHLSSTPATQARQVPHKPPPQPRPSIRCMRINNAHKEFNKACVAGTNKLTSSLPIAWQIERTPSGVTPLVASQCTTCTAGSATQKAVCHSARTVNLLLHLLVKRCCSCCPLCSTAARCNSLWRCAAYIAPSESPQS
jgi:hypothetical protein